LINGLFGHAQRLSFLPSHAATDALAQELGQTRSSGRGVGRRWRVLWRSIVLGIVLGALRRLRRKNLVPQFKFDFCAFCAAICGDSIRFVAIRADKRNSGISSGNLV